MEIGNKVKVFRKEKGINQKKLAQMAGISNSFLCDIEVGRTSPSIKTLEAIAKALDINMRDFF